MNKSTLKGNAKEAFSSLEKRKIVEELRSGMLTIKQSTKQNQAVKVLSTKPSFLMKPSQTTVEQLKQELAEAQAQLAQVKLQNTALETMISGAEKQLNIEIRI